MKYKWLNNVNNSSVIVFFNGWGMDESIVSNLSFNTFDVLMFYDYNTLDTDFDFTTIKNYKFRHLIAWSMGVMVATLFDDNYNTKTAINGTLKPINNRFGIPERIYDLTLKSFSPKGAEKFIKNMFPIECNLPIVTRNFENQKNELFALKNYSSNTNFKYSKVIISDNDKIIPTKNQMAYWNIEPNISGGHAIFYLIDSWSELI